MQYLDFEKPIKDLQEKIDILKTTNDTGNLDLADELKRLEKKCLDLTKQIYQKLTDWQIIQLARHPDRPYSNDYIRLAFTDFQELHGDRSFADDPAIVGGLARIEGHPCMVIGQQKGRDTKQKIYRNFGMPHPEGYRKSLRLMKMANRYQLPVVCLIDTPGAYPGINAEARGQSEAIATNLREMAKLDVPVVCVIIGEGCSGGALGIGIGDCLLMLQYSYFATISPEGCASILWKSAEKASKAAEIMGITAKKLKQVNMVDEVLNEPLGGAHRNHQAMADTLKQAVSQKINQLMALSPSELKDNRYKRLMSFGQFSE